MRCFADRLKNFYFTENWPNEKIRANPLEIADAGFYYLLNKDRVKCWYCNSGLQNWDKFDFPWEEHAKFFPKCAFLLKSKGLEFVKNFVKKCPKLKRTTLPNPAAIDIEDNLVFLKSVPVPIAKKLILSPFFDPRKNTEREEKIQKEMTNGKNVEMARILGFQEEKIRHVLEQIFQKNDKKFPTFHDKMDALMKAADFSKSNMNLEQTRRVLMEEKMRKVCQKKKVVFWKFHVAI